MNALYNELLTTLNTQGPQRLEERLVSLDTVAMRALIASMHIVMEGSPRDQLRQHFGLNTYASGMPLGERVQHEDIPLPPPTPYTGPIVDLNGNDVPPPIAAVAQRPWGSVTSSSHIFEMLSLENAELPSGVCSVLIDVYRSMAHDTGPTALNRTVIKLMVENAKANHKLPPSTKMVRDQEIVSLLSVLKSSDRKIAARFPTVDQLSARYIYKRGTHSVHPFCLDMDHQRDIQITADLNGWSMVTSTFHCYLFLYKRDPSVPEPETLQLRLRAVCNDVGCYTQSTRHQGNRLCRITDFEIDYFNGRIIAKTDEGDIPLNDPPFFYRPNHNRGDKVKIVRDRKLRRSYTGPVSNAMLNRACMVRALHGRTDGTVIYELEPYFRDNITGVERPINHRIHGMPQALLTTAKRTKAFGSI